MHTYPQILASQEKSAREIFPEKTNPVAGGGKRREYEKLAPS